MGFNGFYWVLLGFTGFYWIILGFHWFRWLIFFRVSMSPSFKLRRAHFDAAVPSFTDFLPALHSH